MQIFISYKSLAYRIVKSPITTDWAFLWILHVPRLIFEQCFTVFISWIKECQYSKLLE